MAVILHLFTKLRHLAQRLSQIHILFDKNIAQRLWLSAMYDLWWYSERYTEKSVL